MAVGRVNHQKAVGNGGRPAPHHPIPGNMWTKGLSTADRPQKKKEIPIRMTLVITQGRGASGKLAFVQLFCCRVAWSNPNVRDDWLCKGDDREEAL